MKKKIFLSLLILIGLFAIAGCDTKKGTIVKVIDRKNTSSEMTLNELVDINDSNEAKFDEYYVGSAIEFEATIQKIETNTAVDLGGCTKATGASNEITFEEIDGVTIVLALEKNSYNLSEFNKGDKIKVQTNISNAFINNEGEKYLKVASYDGPRPSCNFGKTPTTITKK